MHDEVFSVPTISVTDTTPFGESRQSNHSLDLTQSKDLSDLVGNSSRSNLLVNQPLILTAHLESFPWEDPSSQLDASQLFDATYPDYLNTDYASPDKIWTNENALADETYEQAPSTSNKRRRVHHDARPAKKPTETQRSKISEATRAILESHFSHDPYPCEDDIEYLARTAGIARQATRNWFSNTRSRRRSSPCGKRFMKTSGKGLAALMLMQEMIVALIMVPLYQ